MKKTPLQEVRERFESKQALVDQLTGMLPERDDETKDEWKQRLLATPNSKLLRLHRHAEAVQSRFGGVDGLVDAVCKLKFAGARVEEAWREKAQGLSLGRLLDLHDSLARKARAA